MEDRETARMRKYGESKTTRIMMATVPHVTSGLGLRKFQADGFLLTRVDVRKEATESLNTRKRNTLKVQSAILINSIRNNQRKYRPVYISHFY